LPAPARFSKTAAPDAQPYFVVEADESDGSLREFHPEHSIVLNVDAEHLDFYSNLEAIGQEFAQFASQTRGHLVFCADDSRLAELFARRARAVSYGFHPLAAYRCELKTEIVTNGNERSKPETLFSVWHKGEKLGEFSTALLGEKNVSNATAVVALLHQLGLAATKIALAIAPFHGAARRHDLVVVDLGAAINGLVGIRSFSRRTAGMLACTMMVALRTGRTGRDRQAGRTGPPARATQCHAVAAGGLGQPAINRWSISKYRLFAPFFRRRLLGQRPGNI
jgi:hypothetical protein